MESSFHSKGKLLLTGEYVVLDGAKALALPTKKGQSLTVKINDSGILKWNSFDCHQKHWYTTELKTEILFDDTPPKGNSKFDETLFNILWEALQLNPGFLNKNIGYQVDTHLDFERLWGLGTSSTLINNIAQWAKINPFELLNKSFGGSGYDIAAAKANSPIFYTRNLIDINNPTIHTATFDPPFKENLFFVYLEEKKDSKEAIQNYKAQSKDSLAEVIKQINDITEKITFCNNLTDFEKLLLEHENIIASILNCNTIQKTRFNDYTGVVKSLGGWGGDFTLVTGNIRDMKYFKEKNYTTIIPYSNMIF